MTVINKVPAAKWNSQVGLNGIFDCFNFLCFEMTITSIVLNTYQQTIKRFCTDDSDQLNDQKLKFTIKIDKEHS